MSVINNLFSYLKFYESEDTKEIFADNEYQSNRLVAIVMIQSAAALVIAWILNYFGIFGIKLNVMGSLVVQGLFELSIPFTLYKLFKGKKRWLKFVMVISLLLVCTRLFGVLNYNVILIMVIPVLLSSRYFSRGFTVLISALSLISLAVAMVSTVFYGLLDLNYLPSPTDGTLIIIHDGLRATLTVFGADTTATVTRLMLNSFIPKLLAFMIIDMVAVLIAQHGHRMVLEQSDISRSSASVKAELDTATQIQNGMVPTIFPPFPDRDEFDIFATMFTAKEVGGDFYDFFLVDENHLALVIADVSGKGVPAALFMMASKILISDRTFMGGKPSEILEFVNTRICNNNIAEMFVTVWLGILDIRTGHIIASNAGHEYPAIRKNGGKFEVLKDRHSFVIGGMEGIKYKDYEFTLNPGDCLFLYTDGIPEANNISEEQFGEQRMVDTLNKNPDASPEELISELKAEVDSFAGEAVQFDDQTMLCFKYNGNK